MSQVQVEYSLPAGDGTERIARAWARVPLIPTPAQRAEQKARAAALLAEHDAVLVAHFYVDGDIQDLALETGGCVADSLEMARFGRDHPARTLVVAGVRFMGETAKILSPDKRILAPDLEATCSLDLGCPPDEFAAFCDANPDRTVVVYANTSAAVKARADWMVTSSCALAIVRHLADRGEKILWAPDRHLGAYIARETGADMLMWNGACVVHEEFKGIELELLRAEHPGRPRPGPPGVARERRRPGGRRRLDVAAAQGGRRRRSPRVHRGDRQRHLPPDAPAGPGQDAHRGPDGGGQRHLQELRPLPVDGDERPGGRDRRAGAGDRRDPRAGAHPQARPRSRSSGCSRSWPSTRTAWSRRPTGSCPTSARPEAAPWPPSTRAAFDRPPAYEPPPANETLAEARARNVRDALREDVGTGDWTAQLVPSGPATARVKVREEAVLCGRDWFEACVRALDPDAAIDWRYDEGADMVADTTVCEVRGDARALLTAERPALNFLQLLSGTATTTRRHVRAIEGASPNPRGCVVLDTRKTIPGLRLAQKYAVRVGGGSNQRLALWDGILVKENHVAAAGGITAAIANARALDAGVEVQVEVETLAQLEEAIAAGAGSILLDNFTLERMREAVALTPGAPSWRFPEA